MNNEEIISMSLEGYFINELRLNYYICKDPSCQKA